MTEINNIPENCKKFVVTSVADMEELYRKAKIEDIIKKMKQSAYEDNNADEHGEQLDKTINEIVNKLKHCDMLDFEKTVKSIEDELLNNNENNTIMDGKKARLDSINLDYDFICVLNQVYPHYADHLKNEDSPIMSLRYSIADLQKFAKGQVERLNFITKNFPEAKYFCYESDGIDQRYFVINDAEKKTEIFYDTPRLGLNEFMHEQENKFFGRNYNTISSDDAADLAYDCINAISRNQGYCLMDNPMCTFKNETKNGKYSDLSDYEYTEKLMSQYNINKLFNASAQSTYIDVFQSLLANCWFDSHELQKMSKMIGSNLHGVACRPMDGKNGLSYNEPVLDKPAKPIESMTPKDIYALIDTNVIHQEDAKKAAAMLMYNHIRGNGRNLMMSGPTGCGKTEIWRTLSKTFPFIEIVNGPNLTAEGYKGAYKLSEIFLKYISDPDMANKLILVIDEADKVFEPSIGSAGTDYSKLIQNELLKIMDHYDGSKVTFCRDQQKQQSITINCKGIYVVLCGTFENMLLQKDAVRNPVGFNCKIKSNNDVTVDDCNEKDYIKHANMRTELTGRVDQIVTLKKMTMSDFMDVINHKTASPIKKLENETNVKIRVNEKAKQRLAKYAADTQLGCRAIKSKLAQCLDSQMFDEPDKGTYYLSKPIIDSFD